MTATDFAEAELDQWRRALEEQRAAEHELQKARDQRARQRVRELLPQVHALSTRADLLLADAVKVKCAFRDREFKAAATERTSGPAPQRKPR